VETPSALKLCKSLSIGVASADATGHRAMYTQEMIKVCVDVSDRDCGAQSRQATARDLSGAAAWSWG